ncbi:MAG: SCP2 sterol-binding domain-containing protein [Gammaproteobacteria bacterium]|nr:SCP2 sterol-binding domain-containing protein [Gammaproteobacteria bacterium]
MLAELFLRPFERLIGRGLEHSEAARALARELDGRTLGLTVEGTPVDLRLHVRDGRVRVALPDGATPDATIRGGPLSLGRLLRADPAAAVREGAVRLGGDAELATRFGELLRAAAPDLEAELTRFAGEPLARELGEAARAFTDWSRDAGRQVERSVAEYLHEESRLLPTRTEVDRFARQVDTLVDDVERAEARLARLESET